jgi:beta-glucosidase
VYFETYQRRGGAGPNAATSPEATAPSVVYTPEAHAYPVRFVKTPEEADVILLWIKPGSKSLFASDGSPLFLSLSKNALDIAYVNALTAKKPTLLVVNYSSPWVIDEICNPGTPGRFRGVLATFGTTPDALLDVVTGKFNPTGKMPFTTPGSKPR